MLPRDRKLFFSSFRTMAVLILIFLVSSAGGFFALSGSEKAAAIRLDVALVNHDTGSQIGTLTLNAAAKHEMLTSLINVTFYETDEEAIQAVRDGATAAIVVPEKFFRSVSHGEGMPCRMIVNNSGDIEKMLLFMFADIGIDLLTTGQLIVFSGDYYMMDRDVSDEVAIDFNNYMNIYSVSELQASQGTYLRKVEIPYTSGGLSMKAHYTILYFSFFLSVILLGMYKLYQSDCTRSRLLMLNTSGISEARFLLWKILLPFFHNLVFFLIFCLVAPRFLPLSFNVVSVFLALLSLLFIAAFGALCSISFSSASGAVLFVIHIIGLFFCGGVIPYSRLKPIALVIGEFTPLGAAYRLFAPLLGGAFSPLALVSAAFYLALFYRLYHSRMRRLMSGKEAA